MKTKNNFKKITFIEQLIANSANVFI